MSTARFFLNIVGGGAMIGAATAYSSKTSIEQAESMSKITGKDYEVVTFAFAGKIGHRIVEKKPNIATVEEHKPQVRMGNTSSS